MFLECRGARVGFEVESLHFVPSGPALVKRRTVVVLHGSRSASSRASDRQMFSGVHEQFHLVHAWIEPAGTASSHANAGALAQSMEEFCSRLELDNLLLVGVGAAAPIATLLATRAPSLVSRLLIVDDAKPGASVPVRAQLESFLGAP